MFAFVFRHHRTNITLSFYYFIFILDVAGDTIQETSVYQPGVGVKRA